MGSDKKRKEKTLPVSMVIQPCQHLAGTEEKILWMQSRLKYNLPLHIPGDCKLPIHPHDKNRNIRDRVNNREIIPDPDEDEDDDEDDLDDI